MELRFSNLAPSGKWRDVHGEADVDGRNAELSFLGIHFMKSEQNMYFLSHFLFPFQVMPLLNRQLGWI